MCPRGGAKVPDAGTPAVVQVVGALPAWGYSRNWGYAPSGGLGLVLLILVILLLMGRI